MDPYLEQPTMWADVHNSLIPAMRDQIEAQLPEQYIAVITPYVTLESIEISPTRRAFYPDVGVLQDAGDPPPAASGDTATTVAIAAPHLTVPAAMHVPTRYARIEIRSITHDTLITSLELLSPANKRPGADGADAYEAKRQEIFTSGVHLLELDLLRGGTRPQVARPLPPASYFVFLSRSYRRPLVEVWPIQLHAVLPVVPVPLTYPDPDVPLNLTPLLHTIYRNARYARRIDYRADPPPPALSPEDAAWLAAHLRAAGVR